LVSIVIFSEFPVCSTFFSAWGNYTLSNPPTRSTAVFGYHPEPVGSGGHIHSGTLNNLREGGTAVGGEYKLLHVAVVVLKYYRSHIFIDLRAARPKAGCKG
jgi:hypothetical protein